jgi:predicted nucleotidyltransferase
MEIIKDTIRVGNSAGVLVPKKWLNSKVRIILEPLDIEKDILDILIGQGILRETKGVYIVGSYARNEQTIDSDIDVLVVTSNVDKKIRKNRYEIMCISIKELENQVTKNILPILAMLKEAKVILNSELIEKYKKTRLNWKNLRFHIETTKSAMNVVKEDLKISVEMGEQVSDASAYSLILRLRTLYIIECIRKSRMWSKKEFLNLVKKITGSLTAYNRYVIMKSKNDLDSKLPIKEAEKLMKYINKKAIELEKWVKEQKD